MKTVKEKTGIVIIAIILLFMSITPGCVQQRPDPEAGINMWIESVNDRNIQKLYRIAPAEVRDQIYEDEFIREQETNPLLAPGNRIIHYTILDREDSGITATFIVRLILETPTSTESSSKIPLYIRFNEVYENGEWKVWTAEP